jgi:hypothetical protein
MLEHIAVVAQRYAQSLSKMRKDEAEVRRLQDRISETRAALEADSKSLLMRVGTHTPRKILWINDNETLIVEHGVGISLERIERADALTMGQAVPEDAA